jgi:hypothetical protein
MNSSAISNSNSIFVRAEMPVDSISLPGTLQLHITSAASRNIAYLLVPKQRGSFATTSLHSAIGLLGKTSTKIVILLSSVALLYEPNTNSVAS